MSLESSSSFWDAITFLFAVGGAVVLFFGGISSIVARRYARQLAREKAEQSQRERAAHEQAIASLRLDVAKAEARAAEANEKAERLRADNLELEKIIQPRRLPLIFKDLNSLKAFAGTELLVQEVPDFEAMRLGRDIRWVFSRAGWKPSNVSWERTGIAPLNMPDGLMIVLTVPPPLNKYRLPERPTNAQEGRMFDAARFLNEYLQSNGIDNTFQPGMLLNRSLNLPANAILVLVGANPIFTKLSMRRPPKMSIK